MKICFFLSNLLLASLILVALSGCEEETDRKSFSLIDDNYSGVNFINRIEYTEEFNPYTNKNFYNGAGVAIGDINNDGLPDLYFAGNQTENQLYLNRGNFKFKDISTLSGTLCSNVWSTGVLMVDINSDGWLDIYVCKSAGPTDGGIIHNELFINNHDLTFTEQSKKYGLDILGLSTHAAFFDYDKDGDLDCYILSNSTKSVGGFDLIKNRRTIADENNQGAKLLKNNNGYFEDVTTQAGIYSSKIGFGLGVSISDLNLDGWQDIYVSNDFFERDYLYINNGDGTFTEQLTDYFDSISLGSMGAEIADLNNDAMPDIIVTEMLPSRIDRYRTKSVFESWEKQKLSAENGYHFQFPRNVYQQNTGDKHFQEIGRLLGLDASDWSWGALAADFDGDGWKDLFIANGIGKDLTDQDYVNFTADPANVRRLIRDKGMVIKELVDKIPSEPISNFMLKNSDGIQFDQVSERWGLNQASFSNGASYADLDLDGDLDLVVSNINQICFLYRNEIDYKSITLTLKGVGQNTKAVGSKVLVYSEGRTSFYEVSPSRGFMSSVDYNLIVPIADSNKADSVEVIWPTGFISKYYDLISDSLYNIVESDHLNLKTPAKNGLSVNKVFGVVNALPHLDAENDYNDFDRDRLLYHMISNEGPRLCKGDVNGDRLEDIYVGGSRDESGSLYVQNSEGNFTKVKADIFDVDRVSEDCGCLFFDADNDGDTDLYVTSGGNEFPSSSTALIDRLYINEGSLRFHKSDQLLPTAKFESTSVVKASDFDGDGDLDLFVGVRVQPFAYGVPGNGYLLENDGKGRFRDVSSQRAPMLIGIGMITDGLWSDVNGDGLDDLLIVGEWMGIKLLLNTGKEFKDASAGYGLSHSSGWWNKIVSGDLDGDGDADYVLGNHGLNSQFKASAEKPVSMWVNDFDKNGSVEQIICRWWGDRQYPVALRHDLLSQLPGLKKRYLKYDSYKDQGIEDIFSADELRGSLKFDVEELRTVVLYNEGDHFSLVALPLEAQLSPMYGIGIDDYDNDGHADILLGGNQYRAKPEVGRYDASYGTLLKGDGHRNFKTIPSLQSGFHIRGEIREIVNIPLKNKKLVMFSVNGDSLRSLSYK